METIPAGWVGYNREIHMGLIDKVEVLPVLYPEPNDFNAQRSLLFVRIETSDGAVGWGEAISQFPASSHAFEEAPEKVQFAAALVVNV